VIKALCKIKRPEIAMRPYIVQLFGALNNDQSELENIFKRICLDLYQNKTIPDRLAKASAYSKVDKFMVELKYVLDPLIRKEPGELKHKDTAKAKMRQIMDSLQKRIGNLKSMDSRTFLSDFSPWLAEFQACKYATEVEIPGQYTGDRVPNPKYHVKFSTFGDKVEVLKSIRQPIRFSCIGNTGQSYCYIVKAGEDLRQDERIQLLFNIMNNVFLEDQFCRERQLKIKTYKVKLINYKMLHMD